MYVFVDLDDPTINLQRFMLNLKQILLEYNTTMPVYACSVKATDKNRILCEKVEANLLIKPITVDKVRHLVDTPQ